MDGLTPLPGLVAGVLLAAVALAYAGGLLRFAAGLRRVLRAPLAPLPTPAPFVTVVVPARDEEAHVEACAEALLASDYPPGAFEVVVVDDFSTDATADRVRALQAATGDPRLRLIRLADRLDRPDQGHKGEALAWGIHEAAGRLILTTDADCLADPGWLAAMARAFASPRVGFVAGGVRMAPGPGPLGALQALEFAGLVGVGAGALGAGQPNLCNSASMGYPRRVFEALRVVGAREEPDPWDDEFMLHRIAREPGLEPRFCPSPAAVVTTPTEPSFRAFLDQRRRWAATGARYDEAAGRTARVAWCSHAALLVGALAAPFLPGLGPWVAGAFGLKALGELAVLVPITGHLGQRRLLAWYPLAAVLHVPYLVGMGLAALAGPPAWKGRTFRPTP